MLENLTILTPETFGRFVGDAGTCLVVAFRQGCPNCQVLMAVIDRCRSRFPQVAVAGIDADQSPDLLERAGVTRVPTVIVYRDGEVSGQRPGVMSPSELLELVRGGTASTV